ncbi:hypothetical protein HHUSO_G11756 [Huso huso]|uniref:Uncharacterized protein n=1 Tax=Huso huso TaxID=61971 RepID=A0ABR0ZM09_HUSHU
MASISADAVEGYTAITSLIERLMTETNTLAKYQKHTVRHNAALSQLTKSFNQAQARLEKVAAVKCGSELLNQ